jgi:hypothetical protein
MPEGDIHTRLARICKAERDAVRVEVRLGGCLPLVAAAGMDIVATIPTFLRRQAPVVIGNLDNRGDEVRVVTCPKLDYKTLWVRAKEDKYATFYLEYLRQCHGLDLAALPKPYNVDHLFNQKRALKYGYAYVRLGLVPGPVNQSHGAGYEKAVTRSERQRRDTSRALMDEIGCMKFYGYMTPTADLPRQSEIDAYVRFAATEFNMPEREVRQSLAILLDKAEFFKTKRTGN